MQLSSVSGVAAAAAAAELSSLSARRALSAASGCRSWLAARPTRSRSARGAAARETATATRRIQIGPASLRRRQAAAKVVLRPRPTLWKPVSD